MARTRIGEEEVDTDEGQQQGRTRDNNNTRQGTKGEYEEKEDEGQQ